MEEFDERYNQAISTDSILDLCRLARVKAMASISVHQEIIEKLHRAYKIKGYVTEESVFDAIIEHDLPWMKWIMYVIIFFLWV